MHRFSLHLPPLSILPPTLSILQGAINYETVVANHSNHKPSKKDSSHKFILSLVNKLNDIIGHVTSLLSPGSLVAMVMHLLHVGGAEVQGKALKITASKLEEGKRYFSPDQVHVYVHVYTVNTHWQRQQSVKRLSCLERDLNP